MPLLGTRGAASARGVGFGFRRSALFAFSSFTFGVAGRTQNSPAPYSEFIASYNTTANPWLLDTRFYSVPTNGFQRFVVPETGLYRITSAGASGGWSASGGNANTIGRGGIIAADFLLTEETELFFVVGHIGTPDSPVAPTSTTPRSRAFNGGGNSSRNGGGGGGASDVRAVGTALTNRIIVGGGGGGASHETPGGDGGWPNGTNGLNGLGGTQSSGGLSGQGADGTSTGGCVGGGGGGYFGGSLSALAHGNTGGGGSSYHDPSSTLFSHTTGGQTGAGYITIERIS